MGLLSKAARGPSAVIKTETTESGTKTKSRGGLLKVITQKQAAAKLPVYTGGAKTVFASPRERAVMASLVSGYEQFGAFQGLVMEAVKYSAGEFLGRISSIAGTAAAAQGLATGRCLLIFDGRQDGELIARHLSKTIPGKNLFAFHAKTPEEAFTLLKPYL